MSLNPYAPPTEEASRTASGLLPTPARFRSLRWLVWVNGFLLLACSFVNLASIRNESRLDVFKFSVPDDALIASVVADRQGLEALGFVFRTLTGLAFCTFLHRAQGNLSVLGVEGPRYANYQVWISWFIPILSLWRPYQIVRDLWNASAPGDPAETWRSEGKGGHGLVSLWWAAWSLNYLLTLTTMLSGTRPIMNGIQTKQVASAVDVGTAVFALLVVAGIAERQRARAVQVADAPAEHRVEEVRGEPTRDPEREPRRRHRR